MNTFLLMTTEKCHLKSAIRMARRTFGDNSWSNIPFVQKSWPQWVINGREKATKDAREYNRTERERYREYPDIQKVFFFIPINVYGA